MNNYDDVEIIDDEITDLSTNNNNAVLDTSYENILVMAMNMLKPLTELWRQH